MSWVVMYQGYWNGQRQTPIRDIAYITSTKTEVHRKGEFATFASKSLGYVPLFKEKKDALSFARKIRNRKRPYSALTITKVYIQEVQAYKR